MRNEMRNEMSDEEFEIIRGNLEDLIKHCLENPDDIKANQDLARISDTLDRIEQEQKEFDRVYYGENSIKNNMDFLGKFKEALEKE